MVPPHRCTVAASVSIGPLLARVVFCWRFAAFFFFASGHLSFCCGGVLRPRPEDRAARAPHTAPARAQQPPPKPIARLKLYPGSEGSRQGAP
ncbi:hypothetical protein NDU88_003399 [Pleurodeles waltl]|uniref:Secreted protein n=1 Tax=Pleurodeles waltl TaxID=8319 RepID=A0AAV7UYD6_PLEWA|nr:hypothetical protein NDU88_003399 [Pleurodeles waltl]